MTKRTDETVFTGSIVVETCWCGIRHGVPRELLEHQRAQWRVGHHQVGIYCPLGHLWIFAGKSELETLQERIQLRDERLERVVADRDRIQRKLTATKGVLTKTKKRAAAGVCPCCSRTFQNVARHIAGQHPGWQDRVNEEG